MNLLVCNVHFEPNSFGGATVVAENLVSEFTHTLGWRVVVVTTHADPNYPEGAIERYSSSTGAEVLSINLLASRDQSSDGLSPNEFFLRALELALSGSTFDVAHIHCVQGMDVRLLAWVRPLTQVLALTFHDCWWQCERQFMIDREGAYCSQTSVDPKVCDARCFVGLERTMRRRKFFGEILKNVDLFFAPSHFHKDYLLKNGIPADKLLVNKNGVKKPGASVESAKNTGNLTFAFLGGPGNIKGFEVIKAAFQGLEASNYRLKLVDAAKNLGGSWRYDLDFECGGVVELCKPFTQNSIDHFFADVDVLLFPSQWKESFGLVVREATVRGVWVVATDCGGPSEDLTDGDNASIIPLSKNPVYLRKTLESLIENPSIVERFKERSRVEGSPVRFIDEQAIELEDFFLSYLKSTAFTGG